MGARPGVVLAYETWGELNTARDNAIYIAHALTGDSPVWGPAESGHHTGGWWNASVGAGRPFNGRHARGVARGRGAVETSLARYTGPALVIAVDSDRLYPLKNSQLLDAALSGSKRVNVVHSAARRDGFLVESGQLNAFIAELEAELQPVRIEPFAGICRPNPERIEPFATPNPRDPIRIEPLLRAMICPAR